VFDPDGANQLRGEHVRRLVNEVRREFFARVPSCPESSTRVVAIEVLDELSVEAQVAVAGDILREDGSIALKREAEEIFAVSDTPQAVLVDLICEVVCQELLSDPVVLIENEMREARSE
jgi:hypothetical protein